ncbi:GNAT family N-acetyltransferase [Jannaschia sp. S6380]|uniref:GNAT family N-acetyltransferase n=1 Tax=Jannaschia sp. S6380 TaxID=2926408 RepID=UPI001FF18983|nr:GNAT family N-acetyltransferase [Jannaschia sp. S6380]MCK0168053.1 GNAT family N-acetyltransferase [Jannaschia sp. S6380]
MTPPTLTTARLILRPHRLEDFEVYAATFASPRAGYVVDTPSRRNAWYSFAADVAGWLLQGHGQWAIDLHDGTHVGQTGISRPDHFPEAEIGWLLHDGHEGHGYATEAAEAARDWARDRVPSLVSYITPGNDRSIAVARRLGATHDPDAPLPDGETADDTVVYRHWGSA